LKIKPNRQGWKGPQGAPEKGKSLKLKGKSAEKDLLLPFLGHGSEAHPRTARLPAKKKSPP
jgi:hypothetical protein